MTRNTLTPKQTFQLNLWCLENKATFPGRTQKALAELASTALGFSITAGNLKGVLETQEIKLERGTPGNPKKPSDRVQVLAKEVAGLFQALGHPVPPNVTAIVQRKAPE